MKRPKRKAATMPPQGPEPALPQGPSAPEEAWFGDLVHETAIPDSPMFGLDAQLARRVHALLEAELRLARQQFADSNIPPARAPFFAAATWFHHMCDPAAWQRRGCAAHGDAPARDCRACAAGGYAVGATWKVIGVSFADRRDPPADEPATTRCPAPRSGQSQHASISSQPTELLTTGQLRRPPGKRHRGVPAQGRRSAL